MALDESNADDECPLTYEEQVEYAAYPEREETTDAEEDHEANCDGDIDPLPF